MNWSEEQKDFVKLKWESGVSARHIADELHTSRNAICGLVNRNHWQTPNVIANRKPREKKAARQVPFNVTRARRPSPTVQPPLEQDPAPSINDMAIPVEQRKTLLELGPDHCRWPVGSPKESDFFFCGAVPLEGSPYCAGHFRRSITPRHDSRPHSFSLAKHSVRL